MTPSARIAAAIEVLDLVFSGAPAEQAVTRWARGARYAGSKDRAALRDHVFQALRCRRSYGALGGGTTGRAVMIGALRAQDMEVASFFTGQGHAPAPLTPDEVQFIGKTALADTQMADADAADLPDWLWQVFQEDLGPDAMAVARAQRDRAPIALRVNENIKSRQETIDILREEGVDTAPVAELSCALLVLSGARRLRSTRAYTTGAIELQDVSSQAAMSHISLPQRARVLDYCVGGGGKVLALAARSALAGAHASFFAHDANAKRMVDLPPRAKRAGTHVTVLAPFSAGNPPPTDPFDVVLCDVPCSGSGTWRRTPDAKWRLTPSDLQEVNENQRDILQSASKLVRPGGQLIYTTCSVLKRENEDQVHWFGNGDRRFQLIDTTRWPVSDMGDGFFFAAFRREM